MKIPLPGATRHFSCKTTYFQQPNKVLQAQRMVGKGYRFSVLFVTLSANWPSYGCYGYYNFEFNNILWRSSHTDLQNAESNLNLTLERWKKNPCIREAECQERNQNICREISELTRLMSVISWVANVLFRVTQSTENGSYLSGSHESLWHSLKTRPSC